MDFFFFARKVCGHRKNLHWFSGSVGKKKKKKGFRKTIIMLNIIIFSEK